MGFLPGASHHPLGVGRTTQGIVVRTSEHHS